LVVPVFSPDGITQGHQLRPNTPRKDKKGKELRYETPGGSRCILDVHPRMLEEVRSGTGELWITEGIKKADSLTSRGLATIGLIGVWNWQRNGEFLPCWDHVRLDGRRVYIVFDSDVMVKEGVQVALDRLVAALEARGAEILVVYLPGPEKGVDDYLVAGHSIAELKMLARKFEPEDIGRIRLTRDEKLRAGIEDMEQRFWAGEWKGMGGHSARDVYLKLIEAAKRHGKVHPDGIRVVKAQGPLAIDAKISSRTLWKALNRLEEWGLVYRDNEGRKPDKSGAFVLRANVSNYGERVSAGGDATRVSQACDPGDLHLRAPRLRWSRPKFTPRRGVVRGTRRVRQSVKLEPRDEIKRLGKIRGAILDVLDKEGRPMDINELAAALHRRRARDIRRRTLPMLEEAGVLKVDDDVVSLTDDWLDALEDQRRLGKEIEADELARTRHKLKSQAYHDRDKVEPPPHWTNSDADGALEDLRPADEPDQAPSAPEVSALAVAVRDYLARSPHDACQPPGWIGVTLWAFGLYPGKPTPTETRAAIEEIGGEDYLRERLRVAKGAAA
jgi:uncharacterized protein DUF3854